MLEIVIIHNAHLRTTLNDLQDLGHITLKTAEYHIFKRRFAFRTNGCIKFETHGIALGAISGQINADQGMMFDLVNVEFLINA